MRGSGRHLCPAERPRAPGGQQAVGKRAPPGPRPSALLFQGPRSWRPWRSRARRGAEVQGRARGAAKPQSRPPERRAGDPNPRAPQPPRQPEAAAIYRGSHVQSLLAAAAATAEYFAQIWLGPERRQGAPRARGGPQEGGGAYRDAERRGRLGSGRWRGERGRRAGGRAERGAGRAPRRPRAGGSQGRARLRAVTAPRPTLHPHPPLGGAEAQRPSPWPGSDTRWGERGAGAGPPGRLAPQRVCVASCLGLLFSTIPGRISGM